MYKDLLWLVVMLHVLGVFSVQGFVIVACSDVRCVRCCVRCCARSVLDAVRCCVR